MFFEYTMPTRLVAGTGCLVEKGALLAPLGEKCLIVTGAHSARKNGSLDDALQALEANGQKSVVYDKVTSNPTIECALEGAALARAERCDFVLAIGGGSPMDAGKAMALLAAHEGGLSPRDVFGASYTRCLPIAAVPTTAGTGSEVTPYAILTDNNTENKTNLGSPLIFPRLAFLDGSYMLGLGRVTTVNTAIDALSHAVEGLLTLRASVLTDSMAMRSIAMLMNSMGELEKEEISLETRHELLVASALAGMVIANTGTTAVHALGYPFTYYRGVDHGRANGLILGEFLAFVEKSHPKEIAAMLAHMGLASVRAFSDMLNGLLREEITITGQEARHFVQKAIVTKNIGNCLARPEAEDLFAVLQNAKLVVIQD
ncbi:iron-containing alcohol dehydrogenase [Desulfovibrio sp. OttesenSCG-928-G15]|nr:iron-containing alcohol dehydrogenase [Desulfovibrio sp. OttesenSCG-928-G15]